MALANWTKTRLFRASALCGVILMGAVAPAAATVNTLEAALIAAYTSNPTLLAQRAQLRATDESVAIAVSGWRPNVSANASYTWTETEGERTTTQAPSAAVTLNEAVQGADFNNDGDQLDDFEITPATLGGQVEIPTDETSETQAYGLTATQNIFRGLRTLNETRQAKANVGAGRADLRSTEQTVLLDAITAYMDVLRDEAVLRLSQNNVAVLDRQLEAARDRFRVGEITRTDVAQSEARLSGAQSNLITSEAQLTASRAAFERVIGTSPGVLQSPPVLPSLPQNEDDAVEVALNKNPTLKSARRSEEAAQYSVAAAKGTLLPTVQLQGSYQVSDTSSEDGTDFFTGDRDSTTTSIVASVTVPLYQSGSAYAQIRQAKQLNSQAKLRIAEAERLVRENVANAWEGLRSARATIDASREQVRANEIAFEGVQQEAQVGSRTTLDVLDAEQELLDSRVSLVRAERNEYVAAFQLLSTLGKLTAEDLGLDTRYYDPSVYYDDVKGRWLGWWTKDE